MCGGGGDVPQPVAPAIPAPVPSPVPADVTPQLTAEQRKNKIGALKLGALSTIKTTPQGIVGAGPDLQTPTATGKKTLGA